MERQADRAYEEQIALVEQAAMQAAKRHDALMQGALRWFAARERGDGKTIAAIERELPRLAARLRAFEGEIALPSNPMERARTYRRVHDALLGMRLGSVLFEVEDEDCPLCAMARCETH